MLSFPHSLAFVITVSPDDVWKENIVVPILSTDPDPLLYHNEAIYRDGAVIGYLTSGNYGHYLGGAIGLGYVKCNSIGETAESQLNAHYQIDVAGKLVDAEVSLRPLYDPKALQVKL